MNRFGMTIPLDGVPLAEQREWIHELEQLGYTDLWSAEAIGYSMPSMSQCFVRNGSLGTVALPGE